MSRTTYTSSFRVGLKLPRKLEGLAYENAESRYPRRTIRSKIEALAYVYAQLKKLNGSPAVCCVILLRARVHADIINCYQ